MLKDRTIVQVLRAPVGGIRKHVLDILFSLDQESVRQIFITNTHEIDFNFDDLKTIKNLKIYHVDIVDKPSVADVFNLFKIYKILKYEKVDVVHGHGAKGGLYSRLVSIMLGAYSIYTPHGGSLHRVYGKIKNLIYDLVERFLVLFTDLYIFESIYSEDTFRKNISNNINSIVNYNGVDIEKYTNSLMYTPQTQIKIASFGLLRHLKGHDIAIRTCGILKKNKISFQYVIYGDGEKKEYLQNLINELNLQNEVSLAGYTQNTNEEMKKYHFIWQPSRFESFGYVPVEAMALKIPVIVSSVGGLKEVVDSDTGLISIENSPESYFEIFKKIYFNEDISLPEIISRAFDKVEEKFSKQSMISKLKQAYRIS